MLLPPADNTTLLAGLMGGAALETVRETDPETVGETVSETNLRGRPSRWRAFVIHTRYRPICTRFWFTMTDMIYVFSNFC